MNNKNNITLAPLGEAITDYYFSLRQAATPLIKMDPDIRLIYSTNTDLYYNHDESDANMKRFYFQHEIYQPLQEVLSRMDRNVVFDPEALTLTNEYRMSPADVATLLKKHFVRGRGLILDSISCPSADYENLLHGIMDADDTALAGVSKDMTKEYMMLGYAQKVYLDLRGKIQPLHPDMVLTAIYRPSKPLRQEYSIMDFDTMKSISMEGVLDVWANSDRYSTVELEIVDDILRSDIFRPFREDCAVHFKRQYGSRPSRPGMAVRPATSSPNNNSEDVISGIKELSAYLKIGTEKAQKMVDSKILQKAGVSYKLGKTNFFNKKKLDEFLAAHPQAFSDI